MIWSLSSKLLHFFPWIVFFLVSRGKYKENTEFYKISQGEGCILCLQRHLVGDMQCTGRAITISYNAKDPQELDFL